MRLVLFAERLSREHSIVSEEAQRQKTTAEPGNLRFSLMK